MNTQTRDSVLADHVDMRIVAVSDDGSLDRNAIVQLDPDHPGFRDPEYRARRNRKRPVRLWPDRWGSRPSR